MAEAEPGSSPVVDPAWEARLMLRAARVGTLATVAGGEPYAALVTPATAPDLAPLLLLSGLSDHTRQLRAAPRCALLVVGPPEARNPQTAPRLSLACLAAEADAPALRARYLAVHPYAGVYAGFGDFALWRLTILGGRFVGGFARAARLRPAALLPDPGAVAAVVGAEADILGHCNAEHADALAAIARAAGGEAEGWRMATVDVDGCDLAAGESVLRIPWTAPVAGPAGVRAELVRLARLARAG
ncbi:MAG: DUF2470 domain-containing protein [Acidisphaera sp.]|nr:DUF2470 domain-containing protein [Acidisphaera sp.]